MNEVASVQSLEFYTIESGKSSSLVDGDGRLGS